MPQAYFTFAKQIFHIEDISLVTSGTNFIEKDLVFRQGLFLVGAGGFGPPKAKPTDLQSAPFGHSGTLPY